MRRPTKFVFYTFLLGSLATGCNGVLGIDAPVAAPGSDAGPASETPGTPTFVDYSAALSVNDLPLKKPAAAQEGDLLLLAVYGGSGNTTLTSPPRGFTKTKQAPASSASHRYDAYWYYRFVEDGEPETYEFPFTVTETTLSAAVVAYRGVAATPGPFEAERFDYSMADPRAIDPVNTSRPNSKIVVMQVLDTSSDVTPKWTAGPDTITRADGRWVFVTEYTKPAPGPSPALYNKATSDPPGDWETANYAVALRPAGVP